MTLTSNLVKGNFTLGTFTYNTLTSADCTLDMTDCKGEILLVLDASACSANTQMTVCAGDYPGKMPDTVYTVPAGSVQYLAVSSGETMKTDGCLHLTFAGGYSSLRVAAVKQRYVTNH